MVLALEGFKLGENILFNFHALYSLNLCETTLFDRHAMNFYMSIDS